MTTIITNQWKSEMIVSGSDPAANSDELSVQIKGGSPMLVNVVELLTAIKLESKVQFELNLPEPSLEDFSGDMIIAKEVQGFAVEDLPLFRSKASGHQKQDMWMSIKPVNQKYLHKMSDIKSWKPAKIIVED